MPLTIQIGSLVGGLSMRHTAQKGGRWGGEGTRGAFLCSPGVFPLVWGSHTAFRHLLSHPQGFLFCIDFFMLNLVDDKSASVAGARCVWVASSCGCQRSLRAASLPPRRTVARVNRAGGRPTDRAASSWSTTRTPLLGPRCGRLQVRVPPWRPLARPPRCAGRGWDWSSSAGAVAPPRTPRPPRGSHNGKV